MAAVQLRQALRQVRGVLAAREAAALTDADLCERYVGAREEAAFETLLRRHGPMVLGICRRILRNEQDAEDAFQATFLVFVRKAADLRSPGTLANWLQGVARRTALAARRALVKRRQKEATALPRRVVPDESRDELLGVLDQELEQLAERYRIAVVLCDLEGRTRKEAARQLGWAEGTVASRLARGRGLLAKRLARRGFAGALVAALAEGMAPAAVPPVLVVSTVTAASSALARATSPGVVSTTVAVLTEGVLRTMFLTKVKGAIAVFLAIALITLSAGSLLSPSWATGPTAGQATAQEPEQAGRDDVRGRLVELQERLHELQREIARLEREAVSGHEEPSGRGAFAANRFKYRVPFEIGSTETREGGRIEIREVWGTRPRIEVGGQYLVRGTYVLPPGERGTLYFYETATGSWGEAPTPTLDLQYSALEKERGDFTLVHGMAGPGYFHLYLAKPERYSRLFANVYFGTGENVLRKKP